jgi:chromosomal replication initiation ATPase DnaA
MQASVDNLVRLNTNAPDDVVIETVVRSVSGTFGISTVAIMGKIRTEEIVDARRAIALMLNNLGYRPQRIARAINRDRSTIYNLIDTAKDLIDKDLSFRVKYGNASAAVSVLT